MNDRNFDQLLDAWMDLGPTSALDRVADAARLEARTTRQTAIPPWWPSRRIPFMNSTAKIVAAAAAVVVAAFLGYSYLVAPNIGSSGLDDPTPSPTPEPSVTEPSSAPAGLLTEGPHVLSNGDALDGMPTAPITVSIPAPDWYGEPGEGILIKNNISGAPDGAGLIVFFGELYVYGDPCQWATTRPDAPATTVDELVAALGAQTSRDASEPVDITVGSYAGKSITLHVPDDAVFSECDRGTFGSWGVPGADLTPFRYHQDPGQIDEVWALDVDGQLVVLDAAWYAGTPQAVVDEMHAIIESASFE